MYLINFTASVEDYVDETIDVFNSQNKILLNQKVKISSHEYNFPYYGFSCKTENRLLEHLGTKILKDFKIREMTIEQIKE